MLILGLSLQTLAVAIVGFIEFASGGQSTLQFVHGVYSGKTDEAARSAAFKKVVSLLHRSTPESTSTNIKQFPWYTAQLPTFWETTNGRFGNFGRLVKVQTGWIWNEVTHCTAFYIAKDILVTSAHCIVEIGITNPTAVELIYVHQENGAADKVSEQAFIDDGRLVTEWWVPATWYNNLADVCDLSMVGFDFAFLKVDKAKRNPADFYTLVAPTEQLKAKAHVFMMGYPTDVPDFHGVVKNDATLHEADKADAAVTKISPPFAVDTLASLKENVLVMVARGGFDGTQLKGAMGKGASGGPVFISSPPGSTPPAAEKRHVIGITSWVQQHRKPDKTRDFSMVIQDATLTPRIRKEITEVQEMLRAGKVGDIRTVTGVTVPKVAPRTDCDSVTTEQ